MKHPLVLVTGVFDLLHAEHVTFLKKAKSLGRLVVGVESDRRVRKIKGLGRPVNNQQTRKQNLEQLAIADEVFILPEQFDQLENYRQLLKKLRPDILAVSTHSPHLETKASLMQEIGGRVEIVHQHNSKISTTQLLAEQGKKNG